MVKLNNLEKLNITGDIIANTSKVIKNVKKWDNILNSEEKEKVNSNLKYKDIKKN